MSIVKVSLNKALLNKLQAFWLRHKPDVEFPVHYYHASAVGNTRFDEGRSVVVADLDGNDALQAFYRVSMPAPWDLKLKGESFLWIQELCIPKTTHPDSYGDLLDHAKTFADTSVAGLAVSPQTDFEKNVLQKCGFSVLGTEASLKAIRKGACRTPCAKTEYWVYRP